MVTLSSMKHKGEVEYHFMSIGEEVINIASPATSHTIGIIVSICLSDMSISIMKFIRDSCSPFCGHQVLFIGNGFLLCVMELLCSYFVWKYLVVLASKNKTPCVNTNMLHCLYKRKESDLVRILLLKKLGGY